MTNPSLNSPRFIVYKINIDEPDTMFMAELIHPEGGMPRGIYMTDQFDMYSLVMLAVANNAADDRIDVWQVDRRLDWFEPVEADGPGSPLPAGESQNFNLIMNAASLPLDTLFDGILEFTHNAVGSPSRLHVLFRVSEQDVPPNSEGSTPDDFGISAIFPNPFNSCATVRFSLDRVEPATLIAYDLLGRRVAVLCNRQEAQVGNQVIVWDAGGLASGVYILRLKSGDRSQTAKVLLVR
jgi:hypothetical protein